MAEQITVSAAEPGDINENDILFECGNCGKSLVIDRRGAGLTINCPDCDAVLEVPIPDGVDLAEFDENLAESETVPEEAAAAEADKAEDILDPESLPEEFRSQVQSLVTEVQELRFRRRAFDQREALYLRHIQSIAGQLTLMRAAMERIEENLDNMSEKSSEDTQVV